MNKANEVKKIQAIGTYTGLGAIFSVVSETETAYRINTNVGELRINKKTMRSEDSSSRFVLVK